MGNNKLIIAMFIPVIVGAILSGSTKSQAIVALRCISWVSAVILGVLGGWIYTPFVFAVFAAYNLRKLVNLYEETHTIPESATSTKSLELPVQDNSQEFCSCLYNHEPGAQFCIECGKPIQKGYTKGTIKLPPFH